jgi:hypothetical protein
MAGTVHQLTLPGKLPSLRRRPHTEADASGFTGTHGKGFGINQLTRSALPVTVNTN